MIRRLGGARDTLDAAVRSAGVDPGGQAPVRTRALDAAAALVDGNGLAAATLEAIAIHAQCSVHSLYAVFGGRDELLRALFERHSPLLAIEDFFDSDHGDLVTTVRRLYRMIGGTLAGEPRVAPALLAEALARPDSPAIQNLLGHNAPRVLASLGAWLTGEIQAGHIRDDIALPLLIQQLIAPIAIHMLMRPRCPRYPDSSCPTSTPSTTPSPTHFSVRSPLRQPRGSTPGGRSHEHIRSDPHGSHRAGDGIHRRRCRPRRQTRMVREACARINGTVAQADQCGHRTPIDEQALAPIVLGLASRLTA